MPLKTLLLFLYFCSTNLLAQEKSVQKVDGSSRLFLHLDKTVYTPEETIWFKAYLLGDTSLAAKVLYVRIIDEEKIVIAEAQFPMYDIRSHGSIVLSKPSETRWAKGKYVFDPPRIILEGKHTLFAYTDHMAAMGDTNVFVQHFEVKRIQGRRLEAQANVADTSQLRKGGQVRVMIKLSDAGSRAENVKGEYQLLAGSKEMKYGKLQTNSFGEAFVNFIYPEIQANKILKLKMLFTQGADDVELMLNLSKEGLKPILPDSASKGHKDYQVMLTTEQLDYGTRKKVKVNLRITDSLGRPVIANFSASIAEKNRMVDLQRLNGNLQARPGKVPSILQIRTGLIGKVISMRYDSPERYMIPANGKIKEVEIRSLRGISLSDQKIKPLLEKRILKVDQKSQLFFIPDSLLHSRKGQEWSLVIPYIDNVPHRFQYIVEWQSPDIAFDQALMNGTQLIRQERFSSFVSEKSLSPAGFSFQNENLLKEVVIGKMEKIRPRKIRQSNCERYDLAVIDEHIKHIHRTIPPVVRKKIYPYAWNDFGEARSATYLGCGIYREINFIPNISIPETFHHLDYEVNPVLQTDTRSTLFWEPNLLTDAEGKASFSFYTSDLTGDFEIVAQGLDIRTFLPLSGKGGFHVK